MKNKKTPSYMMISGWLPVSMSHYKLFEKSWVSIDLCDDWGVYNCLKIIVDKINDKVKKEKIEKIIIKYIMVTEFAKKYKKNYFSISKEFAKEAYIFIKEYIEIEKYYTDFHKDIIKEIHHEFKRIS